MRRDAIALRLGGGWLAWIAALCLLCCAAPALAIPAFAQQTGQPCAQCHVGAFGPQLKPYGRDFKLFGYVNGDGRNHAPPVAVVALTSFTATQAAQPTAPAAHFATNDNAALDEVSFYYGGRVAAGAGAFAEVTYDGIGRTLTIDDLDIKRAVDLGDDRRDLVIGLDLNNKPTVQDLWNSTPTWGFPYNASSLAPTPSNTVLLDGTLAQRVLGLGVYGMWNDLIYAEINAYTPVNNRTADRLGLLLPAGSDTYEGISPYWRVAAEHDFDGHDVEVGAFGMQAQRQPGGDGAAGADRIRDVAADASYQYAPSARQFVSAHGVWIHETDTLDASHALLGSRRQDYLDTLRADVSYSYRDTWIPSVQVFRTSGSRDPLYFGGATGRPDSRGYIVELAYVPFGKTAPSGFISNVRLALQWVSYSQFDGLDRGASNNNTIYLSTRIAIATFSGLVNR